MRRLCDCCCDRRVFITAGLGGIACLAVPNLLHARPAVAAGDERVTADGVRAIVRPETLFAGLRKPITTRDQLAARVAILEEACGDRIAGPLTHILRFDTPVEGFDSELGFPVSAPVTTDAITTHTLREMHFYTRRHAGPPESLSTTIGSLYEYMRLTGLSPELELVEVYTDRDAGGALGSTVDVMAAFLAWPEVYRAQLVRVLGEDAANIVWAGGEAMTPHTPVDPRCDWVARSIDRLKTRSTPDQHFDILSRVALVRPPEGIARYKALYQESRSIEAVFAAQNEHLKTTPTGGFVDPPRVDGSTLHISKVPRDRKAYEAARNHTEKREAYCFCNLVRGAKDPRIDPIFCYRAAGWSRQFWEAILEVEFTSCTITHSILKGDDFCAWDYTLPSSLPGVPTPQETT